MARRDGTYSPYRMELQTRLKGAAPSLIVSHRLEKQLLRRGVRSFYGTTTINHDVFVHFWVDGQKRSIQITPAGRMVGWVPAGQSINDRAHWVQS